MSTVIPCTHCGQDLREHGYAEFYGFVHRDYDPEGVDRVELILGCRACTEVFNAFVPVSDFQHLVVNWPE